MDDETRLRAVIAELEERVPRNEAVLAFDWEHDVVTFAANRRGFLRLGIEFLKAAHAPEGARLAPVDYLLEGPRRPPERYPWHFVRSEDVDELVKEKPRSGPWAGILAVTLAVGAVVLLAVGLFTVVRWVT